MARIVYRGAYATFPMVGLTAGDLALATDLNLLFEWNGAAWFPYHDYPDYEGGKSRLLTVADWAAIEAYDVNLYGFGAGIAISVGISVAYAVPAGRILYITNFAFSSIAVANADKDNNQICIGRLEDVTVPTVFWYQGGNGGGGLTFPKPIVIPALHTLRAYVYNYANHICNIDVVAGGYLI